MPARRQFFFSFLLVLPLLAPPQGPPRLAAQHVPAAGSPISDTVSDAVSDTTSVPGEINGIVTDITGKPLGGVLITIGNTTKGRTGSLTTQSSGRYRFIPIDPDIPFTLGFVKRGFYSESRDEIRVQSGDEVTVNVQLRPSSTHELAAVKIIATPPKGSKLARKVVNADELRQANTPSLLDALQRLRPMMLQTHHDAGICTDSFSLYIDGIRRPVFDPPADSYDSTLARIWRKPLSQVVFERELQWVRPEDVAQVRYISCDDYDPEINRRNVIWVVTKRAAAAAEDLAREAAQDSTREATRKAAQKASRDSLQKQVPRDSTSQ